MRHAAAWARAGFSVALVCFLTAGSSQLVGCTKAPPGPGDLSGQPPPAASEESTAPTGPRTRQDDNFSSSDRALELSGGAVRTVFGNPPPPWRVNGPTLWIQTPKPPTDVQVFSMFRRMGESLGASGTAGLAFYTKGAKPELRIYYWNLKQRRIVRDEGILRDPVFSFKPGPEVRVKVTVRPVAVMSGVDISAMYGLASGRVKANWR
jgi:hypothetical protein